MTKVKFNKYSLSGLAAALAKRYSVSNEFRIHYGAVGIDDSGKLDRYIVTSADRIALEYDSKLHLKYKSILKMLLSDTNVCIGVYSGVPSPSKYNARLYYDNLLRLNSIRKKCKLFHLLKIFYLINLRTKKIKKLYV